MTTLMKFGDYLFPYNPSGVRIDRKRVIGVRFSPFAGSIVNDCGKEAKRISGEGSFFGEDAEFECAELKAVFEAGGSLWLEIAGETIRAYFETLSFEYSAENNAVRYRFGFVEDTSFAEGQ